MVTGESVAATGVAEGSSAGEEESRTSCTGAVGSGGLGSGLGGWLGTGKGTAPGRLSAEAGGESRRSSRRAAAKYVRGVVQSAVAWGPWQRRQPTVQVSIAWPKREQRVRYAAVHWAR